MNEPVDPKLLQLYREDILPKTKKLCDVLLEGSPVTDIQRNQIEKRFATLIFHTAHYLGYNEWPDEAK
jgi:hypothetical protein